MKTTDQVIRERGLYLDPRLEQLTLGMQEFKHVVQSLQLETLKEHNLTDMLMEFWLFLDDYKKVPDAVIEGEMDEYYWMRTIIEKFMVNFKKTTLS